MTVSLPERGAEQLRLLRGQHILSVEQFTPALLQPLFAQAKSFATLVASGQRSTPLEGLIVANLFYEPSTRTDLSFQAAVARLGGRIITTAGGVHYSSVTKGESLHDTVKTIGCYADAIVLRHPVQGAAREAAEASDDLSHTTGRRVPIINAGDGIGEHPTQALLDLYTIHKEIGSIDGLKIAMVGDLAQGRTVRSLAYLLSKFKDIKMYFVAPPLLKMKEDILEHLEEHGSWFSEETTLDRVLPEVDVVYQTRVQKERFGDRIADYESCRGIYVINQNSLRLMKPNAIIMHPLPRLEEISMEVDQDRRAAYFRQAQNGLFVRMALLTALLSK